MRVLLEKLLNYLYYAKDYVEDRQDYGSRRMALMGIGEALVEKSAPQYLYKELSQGVNILFFRSVLEENN